jgi:hypothetical protein
LLADSALVLEDQHDGAGDRDPVGAPNDDAEIPLAVGIRRANDLWSPGQRGLLMTIRARGEERAEQPATRAQAEDAPHL